MAPSQLGFFRRWIGILVLLSVPAESFRVTPPASKGAGLQRRDIAPISKRDSGDDLTKKDLNVRLYQVRDYYRQRPEQGISQADICLALARTRLSKLSLNRCFVAPSTIPGAGDGVFASRDISYGELITLYPGDAALIQDTSGSAEENAVAPVGVMFGIHVKGGDRNITRVTSQEARSYETEINSRCSIVADPLIGKDNAAYLSHFVNDGAALYEFDSASRDVYANETAARCNAANFVMEGAHMTTVATVAIQKGDEVFISYGAGYWLSRSHPELHTGVVVEIEAAVPSGVDFSMLPESPDNGNRKTKQKKKKNDQSGKDKKRGFA
jgi:uncharacterized protein YjlB